MTFSYPSGTMPTLHQVLQAAVAEPAQAVALVEEAIAMVNDLSEWRLLHREPGLPDAARRRVAEEMLVWAKNEGRVWGFRDVARVFADLGDPSAAGAALQDGERFLRARDEPGYVWVLLSKGWTELGNDSEAVEILVRGRARRSAVGEVSSLATCMHELGDPRGRAWLEEASARAAALDTWAVANAWQVVDPRQITAVVHRGLGLCKTLEHAKHVAQASHCHGVPSPALEVAAKMATSASTWLEVAETHAEQGDSDGARRLLELARHDATPDQLEEVAWAYRNWLHDRETADSIAPWGLRPEALLPVLRPREGVDLSALFDLLRARMTAERIHSVASADYGSGLERHTAALRDIVQEGRIPRSIPWEPAEVLQLRRWSQGPDVDHVERAFCATVLVLDEHSWDSDLPILAESCLALGEEMLAPLEALVMGCVACSQYRNSRITALLMAVLLALRRTTDPAVLDPLCEAIDALEDEGYSACKAIVDGSMRADLWRSLMVQIASPHAEVVLAAERVLDWAEPDWATR